MSKTDEDKPRAKAGRPLGSTNRFTKQAIEKAMSTGLLPHEILLSMARGEPQTEYQVDPVTGKVVEILVSLDVEQRKDAAKAAAPYYAPKISTVEVIRNVEDAELDWLIAELTAQTGVAAGADGEGEEAEAGEGAASSHRAKATIVRRKLLAD